MQLNFYKKHKGDKIWWVRDFERRGQLLVSFDKENILNIYSDYPQNFTKEQKELFDKENPFWAYYFKNR